VQLTQFLSRALQQRPNAPLTVYGNRERTVAESADRIARLASGLRTQGLRPGGRVAILAHNSDRYHETVLGTVWAGGVLVPLNTRWNPAEIGFALRHSDAGLLLIDDTFAAAVPELRRACPRLGAVVQWSDVGVSAGMVDYEELLTASVPVADARRRGLDLLGIFYTGGTTGLPKGVMLSHDNVMAAAFGSVALGHFLSPAGRILHLPPTFHLADFACWTAGNLLGSTHVFVPEFDPAAVLRTIVAASVTDLMVIPTMLQMLVDHPGIANHDLAGVTHVLYGGSPITAAVLRRALEAFPKAGFTQAYGMTELAPVATVLGPQDHTHPIRSRSAGRAAPHVEVQIVDSEGVEVPPGGTGEIIVRGDNVMLGYHEAADETVAAVPDGWMRTGDVGTMDEDGYVYVVDRIKDMIVTGGENVYSAEVENVIALHPAVESCAVIGLPDGRWGERVHVFVVPRPGRAVELEDLQDFCRRQIAGYKVPRGLSAVERLPLSGAGKVLKGELRRRHASKSTNETP
jgi:acyl-CoA synthetase (AMP-forming)/AMP-acid ligase II